MIARLRGQIRHYPWGSRSLLADFQGRAGPSVHPEAELWLGAHPLAPAEIEAGGRWLALDQVIEREPETVLGPNALRRFGPRLPFLFKVLAVDAPLSLQAHPDGAQARTGFELESRRAIPLDAPERCYRDAHAKPEMVCALSRFVALVGLRPLDSIRRDARRYGLAPRLPPELATGSWSEWFEWWLDRSGTSDIATAWVNSLGPARDATTARIAELAARFPNDPAILAPLFMHQVVLEPGQALFVPPGELHCYLGGLALEIMGNSDNVLRGGLTNKFVNLPELRRALVWRDRRPKVQSPDLLHERAATYTRCPEFELGFLQLSGGAVHREEARSAAILLCSAGGVEVTPARGPALRLHRGESCFVAATGEAFSVRGDGSVHFARSPV